jgi:hypothetical protein
VLEKFRNCFNFCHKLFGTKALQTKLGVDNSSGAGGVCPAPLCPKIIIALSAWRNGHRNRLRSGVQISPGTDVMIFKIFSPKNSAKKLAFLTQNKGKLCKILIITLVFEKNANFFAENCQKSQKIVIITSTPGFVGVYANQ